MSDPSLSQSMKRRILHIDMDAFFAAVEQKRRPELEGKPVVIGGQGDPSKRGVVSTANYEARKYGIHSAMPMKTAYKMCPRAVFLPVDYEAYSSASVKFKDVLRTVSPIMEDVGIDEDTPSYLNLFLFSIDNITANYATQYNPRFIFLILPSLLARLTMLQIWHSAKLVFSFNSAVDIPSVLA